MVVGQAVEVVLQTGAPTDLGSIGPLERWPGGGVRRAVGFADEVVGIPAPDEVEGGFGGPKANDLLVAASSDTNGFTAEGIPSSTTAAVSRPAFPRRFLHTLEVANGDFVSALVPAKTWAVHRLIVGVFPQTTRI